MTEVLIVLGVELRERTRKVGDHLVVQVARGLVHLRVVHLVVRVAKERKGVARERTAEAAHELGPQQLVQEGARLVARRRLGRKEAREVDDVQAAVVTEVALNVARPVEEAVLVGLVVDAGHVALEVQHGGALLDEVVHLGQIGVHRLATVAAAVHERLVRDGQTRGGEQPVAAVVDDGHEAKVEAVYHTARHHGRLALELVPGDLHGELVRAEEVVLVDGVLEEDRLVQVLFAARDAEARERLDGLLGQRQMALLDDHLPERRRHRHELERQLV